MPLYYVYYIYYDAVVLMYLLRIHIFIFECNITSSYNLLVLFCLFYVVIYFYRSCKSKIQVKIRQKHEQL